MKAEDLELKKLYDPVWEIQNKLAVANKALRALRDEGFIDCDSEEYDAICGIHILIEESFQEAKTLDLYIKKTFGPL